MENLEMNGLNNQKYSNNNELMLDVVNRLENIIKDINDNIIITKIKDIIILINKAINNKEQISKDIHQLNNDINNNISIQNYFSGERYEGELKNGKREGKGVFYFKDRSRYEGNWKNGVKEGKGTYYYSDGKKYEGDWKNDKMEGTGIIYFNSGSRYEGDCINDFMEGKGIFFYNNGDRYEGDFKNDKREGKGIYYYCNGNREIGDYKNDQRIGKHVTLTNDGQVITNNY